MIPLLFLLILLVAVVALGASGSSGLPVHQIAMLVVLFLGFFLSGIYVGAALGVLSFLAAVLVSTRPAYAYFGQVAWETSSNFVFVAVPFFLLMADLLLRAGLSDRLYRALNVWVGRLPGGLLHTNVGTCAVFSTICGSSAATTAMIGSVALPYFQRTKYNERMVLGSLCAGGALGQLIPPGIALIVYGLFTGTSIGQLYAVGFVAGAVVTLCYMAFILAYGLVTRTGETGMVVTWRDRWRSLVDLFPTLVLMLLVLGTLYLGLATASEAGALGVVGALILAALSKRLSLQMVNEAVLSTARTTGMIGLILIGALILNFVLGTLRFPQMLAQAVVGLPLPPVAIMAMIILFYIALGSFMDGFSIILTTVSVTVPVVVALGYDPVWFGVLMTMLVEVALISPPDGMILYIIQGLRKPAGSINDVFLGVLPFMGIYILVAFLMLASPQSFLWVVQGR